MPTTRGALPLRAVVLLGGCAGVTRGAWWLVRSPVRALGRPLLANGPGGVGTVPLETVVVGLCAVLLLGCVLWAVALVVLALAELGARRLAPAGRHARLLGRAVDWGCPRTVRRIVVAAVGAAVGAGIATPVLADTPPSSPTVSGLDLPDRATGSPLAATRRQSLARRPATAPPTGRQRLVVVRAGDSLWSITRALLPPGATDVEVTRGWHRIDEANASHIGADPDLILPGTRLTVPRLTSPHRKDVP